MEAIADCSNAVVRVTLRAAAPTKLHDDAFWRTDGNSPVLVSRDGATVFFSFYEPGGRSFRRSGSRTLEFGAASIPVTLVDDPDPRVGKWIEAVWRDPRSGVLHGWYHAEQRAPCTARLYVPHIGEIVSQDDGRTWRCRGDVLRADDRDFDCSWKNGAVAGGYGDLCVVPDRIDRYLYLAFTSYLTDEAAQGVCLARMPLPRTAAPASGLELWAGQGWQAAGGPPQPLWPQRRGWRHPDPDGFWGPAIHYNRGLGAFVMLLTRTAGGAADLVTEGIYVSINDRLDDPAGWSEPLRIVQGGAWYPQVVGLDEGCGDAEAGSQARFFMAGFSAWSIEFSRPAGAPLDRPLEPTAADFRHLFGAGKPPW